MIRLAASKLKPEHPQLSKKIHGNRKRAMLNHRFREFKTKNVSFLWQKKFFEYCIIILPGVRGAKMTSGTRVRNRGDLEEWPVYLRQLSN